jgi:hypothetical protein
MSKALRITKLDMQRAMQMAQHGCRVIFLPDGSVAVEAVDASAEKEPDSVEQWRRKRDAQKLGGRRA